MGRHGRKQPRPSAPASDGDAPRRRRPTATSTSATSPGPYLAGDVHARYLRRAAWTPHYVFGTDDNQSYVQTNAVRMGLAPQESADRLAADIQADA